MSVLSFANAAGRTGSSSSPSHPSGKHTPLSAQALDWIMAERGSSRQRTQAMEPPPPSPPSPLDKRQGLRDHPESALSATSVWWRQPSSV